MVRMEFFVEKIQKDVEKNASKVKDLMIDIKENNSELSDRFSEQQDKIDNLERQTDVLSETVENKSIVSENMLATEIMRNMTEVEGNIIKDPEERISGLDNLNGVTDEMSLKQSMVSVALNVENIKKDLEKSTSGLNDLQAVTGELNATCKDGLLDLSNKFAALEKQIKELNQETEKKTQTVAFNVMDSYSITGNGAMKFSKIVLNEGDSYDNDTGIFTAPIDGIYQFNAHICIKKGVQSVNYYIKVGDNSIVTGEFFVPDEANDAKCTSFSAAALVRKGENVRVGGMSFSELDRQNDDLSSFSGILIRAA